jgi:hypothetical protein
MIQKPHRLNVQTENLDTLGNCVWITFTKPLKLWIHTIFLPM